METRKYNCNVCFYKTNKKTDYDRHINKKNKCVPSAILPTQLPTPLPEINNIIEPMDNSMELLLKEIQLLKEQLIVKNKIINDLQQQQQLPKQKKSKIIKIDILMKLRNEYQDAMTLDNFVDGIILEYIDINTIKNRVYCAQGKNPKIQYVNGLCNVFMDFYKDLPENQKPIICSNVKTKTFYIKIQDDWVIDNFSTKWKLVESYFLRIIYYMNSILAEYYSVDNNRQRPFEEVMFMRNTGLPIYSASKTISVLAKLLNITENNTDEDTDSGSDDNEPKIYNKFEIAEHTDDICIS